MHFWGSAGNCPSPVINCDRSLRLLRKGLHFLINGGKSFRKATPQLGDHYLGSQKWPERFTVRFCYERNKKQPPFSALREEWSKGTVIEKAKVLS